MVYLHRFSSEKRELYCNDGGNVSTLELSGVQGLCYELYELWKNGKESHVLHL
jgi:hypothetical protein